MQQEVLIQSRDYWYKVVGMLQQNWALIDLYRESRTPGLGYAARRVARCS